MRLPMRTLLYIMEQYGIALSLDGYQLKARIPPGYPAYLKDLMRSRKPEFIAALKETEQGRPDAQPPADLTDHERGLLVQMGLRWGYTHEDWIRLWADCQDPAKRAAWLATARLEAPSQDQDGAEDQDPAVVVRIEGDIGSGRKVFDLRVPLGRWDEAAFDEQVSRLTDARWWRLDRPKTCASCRHQKRTSHPALIACSSPEGDHHYPAAGGHWDTDERMCRSWAPTSHTSTHGQTASTEQEPTR